MKKLPSIVEAVITEQPQWKTATVTTFRTDAACVLESLLAETPMQDVLAMMKRQGLATRGYSSSIRKLMAKATQRRAARNNRA
jgi:hypothetical protein